MDWREVIAKSEAYLAAKKVPDPRVAGDCSSHAFLESGEEA